MSQKKVAGKNTKQRSFMQPVMIGVVVLLIFFLGFTFFSQANQSTIDLASEITVSEAANLREEGAFILDVRQPEEWEVQHIPGATLIPLGELSSRLNEIPMDRQIVVVCRSGNRSAEGRDILINSGFSDVTSMGGGMNVWAANGYEVTSGK